MTPLDKALDRAREDPGKFDDFYELFLSTDLVFPIRDVGLKPGETVAADDREDIEIFVIDAPDGPTLAVFDDPDRLGDWARREINYAAMTGADLLRVLDTSLSLVLHPGSRHQCVMDSDTLANLRTNAEPSR